MQTQESSKIKEDDKIENEEEQDKKDINEESKSSISSGTSHSESKKNKSVIKPSSSSHSQSHSRSRSRSKSKSPIKDKSLSQSHSNSPSRSKSFNRNSQKNFSPKRFQNKRYGYGGEFDSNKDKRNNFNNFSKDKYYNRRENNKYYKKHDIEDSHSNSSDDQKKGKKKIYLPYLDGPLVTFRSFMESQLDNVDRAKAEKYYEKYKKDWETKQIEIFFAEHQNEEWFMEKYDPLLSGKLKQERRDESQRNAERFFDNFINENYENLNLEIDEETFQEKIVKDQIYSDKNDENGEENNNQFNINRVNFHKEIQLEENVDILGEPYFGFDPNCMTLFIKSIPKNISRWEIKENLSKVPGFVSLSLSEPLKTHDFLRFGWILFDTEENCDKGASLLSNLMIKNYAFTIVKSKGQKKPIKVTTKLDNERVRLDLEISKDLIIALDNENKIEHNNILSSNIFANKSPLYQLDLHILYLRKVHSYCFYCAAEYHDERMLSAKCGPIHLRLKYDPEVIHQIQDWHMQCNEIIKNRIKESKSNLQEKKDINEEIDEDLDHELRKKIKSEMYEGKWPCIFCDKMFQGENFVLKHIKNKHESQTKEKLKQIIVKKTMKAYENDKNKIIGGVSGISNAYYPRRNYQKKFHNYNKYNRGSNEKDHRSNKEFKRDYKDLDDPVKVEQTFKTSQNNLINYNDI